MTHATSSKNGAIPTSADYIIVGGGTAGSVLAARLSEDPRVHVVLIEAGPERNFEASEYLAGLTQMWDKKTNWGFETVPQPQLNNRKIIQPQGKVIGGSASINMGVWARGVKENYTAWNMPGWEWEAILETFTKIEASLLPASPMRGSSGPMKLGSSPKGSGMTDKFSEASIELGVGVTQDRNAENPIGYQILENIFRDNVRHNTATQYLNPARARSNLTILTDVQVEKIVIENKVAKGVMFTTADNKKQMITANRETILTAGAYNSPKLLMLSGVGPAQHLQDLGIEVLLDLSGVGQTLSDHIRVPVGTRSPEGVGTVINIDPNNASQMMEWRRYGTGPLALFSNTAAAFIKTSPDIPAPNIELIFDITPPATTDASLASRAGYQIETGVAQPLSHGSMKLASADPATAPIIDPAYLSDPRDVEVLLKGMRIALSYFTSKTLAPLTDLATAELTPDSSDDEILAVARNNAVTIFHPSGTARMGLDDDARAVTDEKLRVRGIDKLRIMDSSVLPNLNSGHTMSPVIMVAEMGAKFL